MIRTENIVSLDICRRSISLSRDEREVLNKRFRTHLLNVAQEFSEQNFDGSLYLSGSLSLGEPSVDIKDDLSLNSDIDLVIVSRTKRAEFESFQEKCNDQYPGYDTTFYALLSKYIPDIHSPSVQNLLESSSRPIVGPDIIKGKNRFELPAESFLPAIAYQLAALLSDNNVDGLTTEVFWRREKLFHSTKLAAEIMKFLARLVIGSSAYTIRDCYDNRDCISNLGIADKQLLRKWAISREQGLPMQEHLSEGPIVLRRALAILFGNRSDCADAITNCLRYSLFSANNVASMFCFLTISYYLYGDENPHIHAFPRTQSLLLSYLCGSTPAGLTANEAAELRDMVECKDGAIGNLIHFLRPFHIKYKFPLKDVGKIRWKIA